ncbi:MAG: hypothetical protein WBA46_09500 [Thermomicrobiales bacterium]
MSLRQRIETHVRQMIDEQGGFDPRRDAQALAIELANDPSVLDDLTTTYLVPEIRRVARQQVSPKDGIREIGGRIQSVAALRAEIEVETAPPAATPMQAPLNLRVADLMTMTKVEVLSLRDRVYTSAIEQAATARVLTRIAHHLDDRGVVGDVLTEQGVRQMAIDALTDQRRVSGLKEIPA